MSVRRRKQSFKAQHFLFDVQLYTPTVTSVNMESTSAANRNLDHVNRNVFSIRIADCIFYFLEVFEHFAKLNLRCMGIQANKNII